MTEAAWVFMLTVWAVVFGSTVYCFWRLLSSQRQLDNGDGQD